MSCSMGVTMIELVPFPLKGKSMIHEELVPCVECGAIPELSRSLHRYWQIYDADGALLSTPVPLLLPIWQVYDAHCGVSLHSYNQAEEDATPDEHRHMVIAMWNEAQSLSTSLRTHP